MEVSVAEKTVVEARALFNTHQSIIENAIKALQARAFYAQYPESDRAYPESANAEAQARYQSQVGNVFLRLRQSADSQVTAHEVSPYTQEALNISYPAFKNPNDYVVAAQKAFAQWKTTDPSVRAGLLVEALERIKNDFFEIAYATMHTTGQAFMMSFQASGPHASDRALEAVALGYQEQTRYPSEVVWEKPMGKTTAVLKKYFKIVPKGVGLAIGCSTFPVWNTVPGIFADLITGNAVVVKPHPNGVYSLAIVVARLQEVLSEYGFDPNTVILAVDTPDKLITKTLCEHQDVKLIDFTGSSAFGSYIEALPNKVSFTEKAGVNSVIIDSATDLKKMLDNLAFSVSLYSGQMCTAPQNFFIPKGGVEINGEKMSFEAVTEALAAAIKGLATHPKAGPAICGAIQSEQTLQRVQSVSSIPGKVLLESQAIQNPEFPNARTATPAVIEVSADAKDVYSSEQFGPIIFVIKTENTEQSIELAANLAKTHGALSCGAYTTNPETMDKIAEAMTDAGVVVSFNLAGQVFVNQNAGFSDFHGTGGNPAGNCAYTDAAFVTKRFTVVGMKVNEN